MPLQAMGLLEDAGFRADNVYRERLSGRSDPEVLSEVVKQNGVLVTCDKRWFGDLRNLQQWPSAVIILLRAKTLQPRVILPLLRNALRDKSVDLQRARGVLVVSKRSGVNVRSLSSL